MLGVLQAIINGQQPDMRAVHRLHELIVSGDLNGDVNTFCLSQKLLGVDCILNSYCACSFIVLLAYGVARCIQLKTAFGMCTFTCMGAVLLLATCWNTYYNIAVFVIRPLTFLLVSQRSIQEIITQDNDLDSDVGMNLIQLLGGSNDFYGTKRRRSSCTSATSDDSILSGR